MKPKNFDRKLNLNKHTVSSLNNREMGHAFAGEIPSIKRCPVTWGPGSCPTRCETLVGQYPCPGWNCDPDTEIC